ncbi:phytoene desaturase family protein [Alkalicoccus urumqiensis]|uniref:Phytoene desaturase n=1 Tax=Alkalicoccus urumqiensis TaxID=1548213 RepID=A0A2P6MKG7_ALKUR|nr:phytoene desaturase family protein [Alkalicoccus urumqiensis]PRO66751.1 phytoene desaturase [Alkalicoccus urumqiensis]
MKTIICGAGLGGLVTALYELKAGNDVEVFEKDSRTGGRLRYRERDGHRIDEGPTIVLLPDMIKDILSELHLEKEIQLVRIDPLYPMHFKNGPSFLKWSDSFKQEQEIERHFPGESGGYKKYVREMNDSFLQGKQSFLDHSFADPKNFWTAGNVKTLLKLRAYQSVRKQSARYFRSTQLQEAFSLQSLYIGGSPSATPAMYSLVSYSEHAHGIWYVYGGYASLAEKLETAVRERGGTVHLNEGVEKVLTKEHSAYGVETETGAYYGDRVILNGDFPGAEKLLPEKKKRSYTPSSGCLLFYIGLNEKPACSYVHQFYMGGGLDSHMNAMFKNDTFADDPSFYVFHPGLIDDSLAPEGRFTLYVLVPVPDASKKTKDEYEEYADKIRENIYMQIDPDLKRKIIWEEQKTPFEAEQEGLFEGGSFGIAPTLLQSGVFRPQLKAAGWENVYAVGASVHPGGGVPIVMNGAKILNDILRREDNDAVAVKKDRTTGKI